MTGCSSLILVLGKIERSRKENRNVCWWFIFFRWLSKVTSGTFILYWLEGRFLSNIPVVVRVLNYIYRTMKMVTTLSQVCELPSQTSICRINNYFSSPLKIIKVIQTYQQKDNSFEYMVFVICVAKLWEQLNGATLQPFYQSILLKKYRKCSHSGYQFTAMNELFVINPILTHIFWFLVKVLGNQFWSCFVLSNGCVERRMIKREFWDCSRIHSLTISIKTSLTCNWRHPLDHHWV